MHNSTRLPSPFRGPERRPSGNSDHLSPHSPTGGSSERRVGDRRGTGSRSTTSSPAPASRSDHSLSSQLPPPPSHLAALVAGPSTIDLGSDPLEPPRRLFDSPGAQAADSRFSRPMSTYTQFEYGSQATATAIDHHDQDFPPSPYQDDDGTFYSSILADLDGYDGDGRDFTDAIKAIKRGSSVKSSRKSHHSASKVTAPLQSRKRASTAQAKSPLAERSPSRQLPTPPIASPKHAEVSCFPGGMGWDESNRPVPRKLSRMEKALLRRVEFGPVGAADIANIPLT